MKVKNANVVRGKFTEMFMAYMKEQGEDVGQMASNTFNFPVVQDGEEGWVEVVVKVPKTDDGYEKRAEYKMKEKEKAEEKERKAKEKAKKIERDQKRREEKKRREEEGE